MKPVPPRFLLAHLGSSLVILVCTGFFLAFACTLHVAPSFSITTSLWFLVLGGLIACAVLTHRISLLEERISASIPLQSPAQVESSSNLLSSCPPSVSLPNPLETPLHLVSEIPLQFLASLAEMMSDEADPLLKTKVTRLGNYASVLAAVYSLLPMSAECSDTQEISSTALQNRLTPFFQSVLGERCLHLEVDSFPLTLRQSTAVALLLCELVTSHSGQAQGKLKISLKKGDKFVRLLFLERGHGKHSGYRPETLDEWGIELIASLVRYDLRGNIQFGSSTRHGFCVIVRFPCLLSSVRDEVSLRQSEETS